MPKSWRSRCRRPRMTDCHSSPGVRRLLTAGRSESLRCAPSTHSGRHEQFVGAFSRSDRGDTYIHFTIARDPRSSSLKYLQPHGQLAKPRLTHRAAIWRAASLPAIALARACAARCSAGLSRSRVHSEGPGCSRGVARAVDTFQSSARRSRSRSARADSAWAHSPFIADADRRLVGPSWRGRTVRFATAAARNGARPVSIASSQPGSRLGTSLAVTPAPSSSTYRSCGSAVSTSARGGLEVGRPFRCSSPRRSPSARRWLSAGRTGACGPRRPSSRAARRWRSPCRGRPPAGPRSRRASVRRSDSRSPA
jgi:hypothetical protein